MGLTTTLARYFRSARGSKTTLSGTRGDDSAARVAPCRNIRHTPHVQPASAGVADERGGFSPARRRALRPTNIARKGDQAIADGGGVCIHIVVLSARRAEALG